MRKSIQISRDQECREDQEDQKDQQDQKNKQDQKDQHQLDQKDQEDLSKFLGVKVVISFEYFGCART